MARGVAGAVLVCAAAALAQDARVTAAVDRTRVGVNESFTLSVTIQGGDAGEPQLPPMDNFASLIGTSSSQNIQFINGRMSSSRTLQYTFLATTPGKFEIGAVKVAIGNKIHQSQPFTIEIIQAGAQPPGASGQTPAPRAPVSADGTLFVIADLSSKRVYQNQPVVVSFKIYTRQSVRGYSVTNLPSFGGFWAEDFPMPRQPQTHYEVIEGQQYLVAEIKRTALFPQAPGKITIDPLVMECEVQVQSQQRRRRDFFDSFFDDPFFSRTQRVAISSKPVSVEVLPLPAEGKPAGFNGAVGNYTISAVIDRGSVPANEAVTYKLTVAGNGNIKTLALSKINFPRDFEVYDPKINETAEPDGNTVSGSKTWEYVLVPRFPGSYEIKPVQLAYFDPAARQYRIASSKPLVIEVSKGSGEYAAASGALSKEDVKLLGQDIRFIALTPSPFKVIGASVLKRTWFLLLLIAPVAAFGGALIFQRHQRKLMTNVAYARSRKATRLAGRQLRQARKLMAANDSKAFYAEVQRALTGFLGNKLNLPEAGLMTEQVEQLMNERQVPPEVVSSYVDCLQACDFQRFAPANTDGQEMAQFYDKARRAIEELEDRL